MTDTTSETDAVEITWNTLAWVYALAMCVLGGVTALTIELLISGGSIFDAFGLFGILEYYPPGLLVAAGMVAPAFLLFIYRDDLPNEVRITHGR